MENSLAINTGRPSTEPNGNSGSRVDGSAVLFKNLGNTTFGSGDSGKNLKLVFVLTLKNLFFFLPFAN